MSTNELFLNRLPIVTGIGTPRIGGEGAPGTGKAKNAAPSSASFQEVLNLTVQNREAQRQVVFSKHAAQRAVQRGVDLSENSLSRLEEGVRMAEAKGLNDTLILVDGTAFLVSIKNNKVITTVNHDELKGNVFTNIDGTVIV